MLIIDRVLAILLDTIAMSILCFLIALFGFGTGFLLYIILWIVMPEKKMGNYSSPDATVDYTVDDAGNAQPIAYKKPVAKKEQENVIGVLILVTLGLVFLADELMPWFSFSKLWPLVIVAIGVGLLWNQNRKSN